MARLQVEAAGSPLFSDFLFVVSVSDENGEPVTKLNKNHFAVHRLASLNHASNKKRTVLKTTQGPPGFYRVQLEKDKVQPKLPPGHYVFGIIVRQTPVRGGETHHGQCVAVGDLPA